MESVGHELAYGASRGRSDLTIDHYCAQRPTIQPATAPNTIPETVIGT